MAERRLIQHKIGVFGSIGEIAVHFERPGGKFAAPEPGDALDADDHIGIDIVLHHDGRMAFARGKWLHDPHPIISGLAMVPPIALAAATAGLARCVKAPGPWRPMKLRFEVDPHRSPRPTRSPLAPPPHQHPGSPPPPPEET